LRKPYVVIYRDQGGEVMERYASAEQASARLNELWGECTDKGPSRHSEARAVLYTWLRAKRG
jgi:hypothetical protein